MAGSAKCGIYDLIQHVETGKVMRWFRDGRATPDGYIDFVTDDPRDYAIMRRLREPVAEPCSERETNP